MKIKEIVKKNEQKRVVSIRVTNKTLQELKYRMLKNGIRTWEKGLVYLLGERERTAKAIFRKIETTVYYGQGKIDGKRVIILDADEYDKFRGNWLE